MATSLIKDIAKTAKVKAVKGLGNAMFGSGIVGGALNKSFQRKFLGKEESDTQVADAISEQEKVQDQNNATLARIETLVVNISDNIYNIAGVLNAQVVSMHEAQRLQQERAFKNAAAAEEATAEALKIESPTPAANAVPQTTDEKGKGGIMDLIGSVMDTKSMFKGFLKKFAIFAAGATALGLAGAAVSNFTGSSDNKSTPANIPNVPGSPGAPGAPGTPGDNGAPGAPIQQPPASPASIMTAPAKPVASVAPPAPQASKTPAAPPPAPTLAAAPPSVAATAPAEDPEASKLKDFFDKPENATDKEQLNTLWQKQQTFVHAIETLKNTPNASPEEKKRNDDIIKNQLEPGLAATKQARSEILNKGRKAISAKQTSSSGVSVAPAGGATAAAPSSSLPAGGGESSSGGGTPVAPPAPSSGSSIGAASTAVAAAQEAAPADNRITTVNNDTTATDTPAPSFIPSPIADRGSLDAGTTFGMGS